MPSTDSITLDTANYLQAINRGVTGITLAPPVASYLTALDTPNLPYALSWPLDGRWYVKGGAARQSVRTWLVAVYIEPLNQSDIPTNAIATMTLLDRMIHAYTNVNAVPIANPPPYQLTIESSPDMQHTDGGVSPSLQFRGVPWYGVQLRVNVRALW